MPSGFHPHTPRLLFQTQGVVPDYKIRDDTDDVQTELAAALEAMAAHLPTLEPLLSEAHSALGEEAGPGSAAGAVAGPLRETGSPKEVLVRLTRHAPSEHRSDNRTSEQRIGNGTKLRDGLRPAEKEAADAKIKAKANAAAAKARAKKEKK